MPGPVVPLPSKNAILDLHWAGCSPIFCSGKRLPSCGLAGSARGIAAVQGGSCGWRIPVAASCPRETRQQHSPWHWGLGTQSCGCCTQPAPLPAKNLQSSSVTPCHGAQHHPTIVQGLGSHKQVPSTRMGGRMLRSTRLVALCPLPSVTWCLAGQHCCRCCQQTRGGSQGGTPGSAGLARGENRWK